MPIYRLDDRLVFPPADHAHASGILAVGGDLRPERLLLGYASGIFPWYDEDSPIQWHSPDPRFVLLASRLHVPKSLRKQMRRGRFRVRLDEQFGEVMRRCGEVPRPGQNGTWITRDMLDAYARLFELGFAHSVEAYDGERLVGGLYGVSLGGVFFGESMFTLEPDASKVAFVTLVEQLVAWGIELVDCQVYTDHLERFGAESWPRARFIEALDAALELPTRRGKWRFGDDVELGEHAVEEGDPP